MGTKANKLSRNTRSFARKAARLAYKTENRRLKNKKRRLTSYCKSYPLDIQAKVRLDKLLKEK